jgi:hypothetical protein
MRLLDLDMRSSCTRKSERDRKCARERERARERLRELIHAGGKRAGFFFLDRRSRACYNIFLYYMRCVYLFPFLIRRGDDTQEVPVRDQRCNRSCSNNNNCTL